MNNKKLLIPIEIRSIINLPDESGLYFCITKEGIKDLYRFEINHEYYSDQWLNVIDIWFKEISEEEYLKKYKEKSENPRIRANKYIPYQLCPKCGCNLQDYVLYAGRQFITDFD